MLTQHPESGSKEHDLHLGTPVLREVGQQIVDMHNKFIQGGPLRLGQLEYHSMLRVARSLRCGTERKGESRAATRTIAFCIKPPLRNYNVIFDTRNRPRRPKACDNSHVKDNNAFLQEVFPGFI